MKDRTNELEDLKLLAVSGLAVPLTWLVALQWRPSQSVAAADAVTFLLPYLKEFSFFHGDWRSFQYVLSASGGVQAHDVYGMLPIFQWAGWLGASPFISINLLSFLVQVCFGFLGARAMLDLARLWGSVFKPGWLSRLGMVWLMAYMPVMGWKIGYGHHVIALGAGVFLTLLALLLAARVERMTWSLAAVAVLTLTHSFPHAGQQTVLYSAVFGAPMLAGTLPPLARREDLTQRLRQAALPAAVFLSSLALSMPKMAGMLAHASSSDAARSLHGPSMIYSYVTATFQDWLSSIPWAEELIPSGREFPLRHEINCPIGPLIVFVILLTPWKRAWAFGSGSVVSALLAILFSMNVPPVPQALSWLVPPLESFRVPERSILPFLMTLSVMAGSIIVFRFGEGPEATRSRGVVPQRGGTAFVALGAATTLFLVPPALREALTWGIALGLSYAVLRGHLPAWARVSAPIVLLAFGAASLSAFRERLLPFPSSEAYELQPERGGAELMWRQPSLASPLTRVHFRTAGGPVGPNEPLVLGLSTLSGYWSPTSRFIRLVSALDGVPARMDALNFRFVDGSTSFEVLKSIYNVRFALIPDPRLGAQLTNLPPTAGPAWFSQSLERVGTFANLAGKLKALSPALAAEAHRTAWVLNEDAPRTLPAETNAACGQASVLDTQARRGDPQIRLRVQTPANCPLTLAANFVSIFEGRALSPAGERRIELFPTYGALTGMIVPAGTTEIIVVPRATVPLWSVLAMWGGWALLGIVAWRIRAMAPIRAVVVRESSARSPQHPPQKNRPLPVSRKSAAGRTQKRSSGGRRP